MGGGQPLGHGPWKTEALPRGLGKEERDMQEGREFRH